MESEAETNGKRCRSQRQPSAIRRSPGYWGREGIILLDTTVMQCCHAVLSYSTVIQECHRAGAVETMLRYTGVLVDAGKKCKLSPISNDTQ